MFTRRKTRKGGEMNFTADTISDRACSIFWDGYHVPATAPTAFAWILLASQQAQKSGAQDLEDTLTAFAQILGEVLEERRAPV